MDWTGCEFVERVEGRCGGRPTIVGTRVWPETIVDWTDDGFSVGDIHRNFPTVTPEQIQGVLEYARKQRQAA